MDKELITVIVPIYKGEQWLDRCIESICTQDYNKIQIVLVDDGSPDNSGRICENWAQRDSRIQVVHKENGGLSDARNAGIDCAKGGYIMFLDEDDYMHPSTVTVMYHVIKKYDADFVACDFEKIPDKMVDSFPEVTMNPDAVCFTGKDIMNQLWYRNIQTVIAWNKIYKSEIFDKVRYIKGRVHDDESAIHYVLHQCKKTAYISEKLYYYVQREGSITAARKWTYYADTFLASKERLKFLNENGYNEMALWTKRQMLFFIANNYRHMQYDNQAKEALEEMLSTFGEFIKDASLCKTISAKQKEGFELFARSPKKYYKKQRAEKRMEKIKSIIGGKR